MFNIHDSPVPKQESPTTQNKSDKKSNPTESTTITKGKRKRTTSRRDGDDQPQVEMDSNASSLDTGRQPPSLREPSDSAETTSSLTAISSTTIPPESITSNTIASDALGRQLTSIRRLFFTPSAECNQQAFLMAHESVVSLLADMRLAMYASSSSFLNQREESIRFVTAIGVVCRTLALKLPWPSPADDILLSPIQNWAPRILRSWEGWIIQFIRIVTCWFDETISPNNVLRELSLARLTAPGVPLVALGGESILFEGLTDMLDSFVRFVRGSEKSVEDKRFWGIEVLRACILLLGDGINFAFIEGAFRPNVEEEEEEEEMAQTQLGAFEVAQSPGIFHGDVDERSSENDDDDEDDDDDDDVDVEEEDDDTFMLRYGEEEDDDDDDDESVPFILFPTRRSGLNHPERHAAENVPTVSHRKAYTGHCNVQTVDSSKDNLISRLKMSITTVWTMNT